MILIGSVKVFGAILKQRKKSISFFEQFQERRSLIWVGEWLSTRAVFKWVAQVILSRVIVIQVEQIHVFASWKICWINEFRHLPINWFHNKIFRGEIMPLDMRLPICPCFMVKIRQRSSSIIHHYFPSWKNIWWLWIVSRLNLPYLGTKSIYLFI